MKIARLLNKTVLMSTVVIGLLGCTSNSGDSNGSGDSGGLPPIGVPSGPSLNQIVVKSRAVMRVSTGGQQASFHLMDLLLPQAHAGVNQDVTVVNSASSTLILDATAFITPAITDAMLDFGDLSITGLYDNDLDVCVDGATHCGTAMIRIYTIGTAQEGLYNSAGGYGIPITAGEVGDTLSNVGLDPGGAVVVQTISIPADKHVVSLASFVNPNYDVQIDFSNAGAGTYSTTLVVEYVLAP